MKYLLIIFLSLATSGCWFTTEHAYVPLGTTPLILWGAGETVSYLATGKIMEDNIASFVTGKDCSLGRKLSSEGKYCMTELELEEANRPKWSVEKIYCYRSLAAPTCYIGPSPNPTDFLIGIYDKPVYPVSKYH